MIKENIIKSNINFFDAPMLSSSVSNSLKFSDIKSLLNGNKFLSKTQSFLTAVATLIIDIWQSINKDKEQFTNGDLLHSMEQSIVL